MNFQELLSGPRPVLLSSCSIPHDMRLLVLAPHPDDFDEVGVTLRFFGDNGNPIFVAVVTSGAGGVEDSFCTPPTIEKKAEVREKEQRRSCRFFGLRDTHLDFLRLLEDHNGHILGDDESLEQIRRCVYGLLFWNSFSLTIRITIAYSDLLRNTACVSAAFHHSCEKSNPVTFKKTGFPALKGLVQYGSVF